MEYEQYGDVGFEEAGDEEGRRAEDDGACDHAFDEVWKGTQEASSEERDKVQTCDDQGTDGRGCCTGAFAVELGSRIVFVVVFESAVRICAAPDGSFKDDASGQEAVGFEASVCGGYCLR